MNNKYFLGIDLGTTNTVAAVGKKETNTNKIKSETILINQKNNLGEPTSSKILPSLLYVGENSLEPGEYAKEQKKQNSKNVICNIKRFMGTNEVKEINKRQFRPREVSAEYLKACRQSAIDEYFYPFDEVVITVPSSYDSEKRRDTKIAAKLAGFTEDKIRLIEEPTAALIDYVYSKSTIDFTDKKRILVYDIGGGTSDISIIDVQIINNEIYLEEKAKNRYDELGGINFDEQCAKRLLEKIIKDHNIDEQQIKKNKKDKMISKLMIFAELVKERFSTKINESKKWKNIVIEEKRTFPQLYNSEDIKVTITYDEYVEYIQSLLYAPKEKAKTINDIEGSRNIETPILDTLKEYNISLDSIDYVYLTGGMSKFPLIKERIKSIQESDFKREQNLRLMKEAKEKQEFLKNIDKTNKGNK